MSSAGLPTLASPTTAPDAVEGPDAAGVAAAAAATRGGLAGPRSSATDGIRLVSRRCRGWVAGARKAASPPSMAVVERRDDTLPPTPVSVPAVPPTTEAVTRGQPA